ncbi:MAG: zinc metalloprotease HtpX, partial [Armatimonadota bacterium]
MAHIRNNDVRLMTTLALTVGLIVLLRDAFLRSRWRYGDGRSRDGNQVLAILAILLLILAPLFATLLHFAVSRKREYLA